LHFINKQAMDEQVTEKLRQLRQLEAGRSEHTQLPMAQKSGWTTKAVCRLAYVP
jgi:hypothetical protein